MKKQGKKGGGLVYSSEFGTMCPGCDRPVAQCGCRAGRLVSPGDGVVRLGRQSKGRQGKGVTLISGLPLEADDLKKLAKALKQKCGCGGTVKDGVIEIQGDQRDLLEQELRGLGYQVKRAGG